MPRQDGDERRGDLSATPGLAREVTDIDEVLDADRFVDRIAAIATPVARPDFLRAQGGGSAPAIAQRGRSSAADMALGAGILLLAALPLALHVGFFRVSPSRGAPPLERDAARARILIAGHSVDPRSPARTVTFPASCHSPRHAG